MICYIKPDRLNFKFGKNRIGKDWSWKMVYHGIEEVDEKLLGYQYYVFEFTQDNGEKFYDHFRSVSPNTPYNYMVGTIAFNHRITE